MAASSASGSNEPVGIINRVDGEVWIERGSERIPVIGSERLHPGDRLISVGDGTAEVRFNALDARGKPLVASVPVGGNVVMPAVEGLKGNALTAEVEKSGMNLDDLPIEDLFNPLQTGASRILAGVMGLDGRVAAAAAAAGFSAAASGAPLNSTEVPVSDNPIPGLGLTREQADAVGEPIAESPALGAASLAALQSVTAVGMPEAQSGTQAQGASDNAGGILPAAGARMSSQTSEPFRPDAAASSALAAGSVAAQTAGLERVSDVAAAAPAMLGKEETIEQLQSDLNSALSQAPDNTDDEEAAALLADVASAANLPNSAQLEGLLGLAAASTGEAPATSPSLAPSSTGNDSDAFSRLLQMIESFEAKINELTGLVYSAFEGVGPDILNAKSEFSELPTQELLSGLSDAVNVVTREVSSLEAGSVANTLDSAVSTMVTGLDDPLSAGADAVGSLVTGLADLSSNAAGSLQQSLGDIGGSLSNVLNTVSDLTGASPVSLTGGLSSLISDFGGDIGGAINLVSTTTGGGASTTGGTVSDLLDNFTGGGGTSGGGTSGGGGLLDNLTGGGGTSGGGLLGGGDLTADLLGGEGGLLTPSTPSSGGDTAGALPDASTSGGGSSSTTSAPDDSMLTTGGTSSGMSSSAGQSPIDPNSQGNPV